MLKIILAGSDGQMGRVITDLVQNSDDFKIVAGLSASPADLPYPNYTDLKEVKEEADVLIDFSDPSALAGILAYGKENGIPLVLATSGYSQADEEAIEEASQSLAIVKSSNMSTGVNVMEIIAEKMAALLKDFDIEIVDSHHRYKKDSPSGTAKMLFNAVNKGRDSSLEGLEGRAGFYDERPNNEVGISSVRAGNIVGNHTIIFAGEDEVLELTHRASSKKIFANGSLKAADFVAQADPGLYTMEDVLA